jgi:hypothetical protein
MDYWIVGWLDYCGGELVGAFPSIHQSTTPTIHFCRAGCEPVEETGQGFDSFVPIAQAQSRRVLSVRLSVRFRLGTPFAGVVQQPERGLAKAETTVRFRSPAPFSGA